MLTTRKNSIKATCSRLFSNRDLAVLFLPLMIEQTLKYSLGLVDSMMVAGVGEAAALLVGGSAVVSQYIGAEEPLKANHYL